jgi:hypothetical protein
VFSARASIGVPIAPASTSAASKTSFAFMIVCLRYYLALPAIWKTARACVGGAGPSHRATSFDQMTR